MMLSPVNTDEEIDQGFILEGLPNPIFKSLKLSVTINPTCLFQNNKVDNVILAYLIPVEFVLKKNKEWQNLLISLEEPMKIGKKSLSSKKTVKVENIISHYIDNDESRRHFFLHGIEDLNIPDTFIDFQQIASFPMKAILENSKPIAKINRPWREKMITNYTGYMVRIGVERYSGEIREKIIENIIKPLKLSI